MDKIWIKGHDRGLKGLGLGSVVAHACPSQGDQAQSNWETAHKMMHLLRAYFQQFGSLRIIPNRLCFLYLRHVRTEKLV